MNSRIPRTFGAYPQRSAIFRAAGDGSLAINHRPILSLRPGQLARANTLGVGLNLGGGGDGEADPFLTLNGDGSVSIRVS